MIPQAKVEEIVHAARIEEVIGDYVNLKKRGANLLGLCPFHNEKTPSFTVSPSKGIYKCFGCGKAGDSVRFIMEHDQLSYPEALRYLANKYNIEVEEVKQTDESIRAQNERDSVLIALKYAGDYFAKQLWETEEGQSIGLSYFEERGFRHETIKKFGLGYSPEGWSRFYEDALKAGYQQEYLKRAGLITINEQGKTFDLFRGRVMFPVHDLSGRLVAFGGRIMKKDPKSPKYVNSPETEVYHKSDILYGYFFAKNEIRKQDRCYLVEGYTDVITLHQGGIENVVASSGTSLTEGQIKLIKRFTENVTVLYDGDQAGLKASLRGVDLILEQGLNVKVVTFPEGEDPDSFCRSQGGEEFSAYIKKNEQDFIIFKSNLLLADSANDPVKRAEVIRDIVESISKVPDHIKRSVFVKECSRLLDINEQVLHNELNKIFRNRRKDEKELVKPQAEEPLNYEELLKENQIELNSKEYQEKDITRILLQYGAEKFDEEKSVAAYILEEFANNELQFENPLYQCILALCRKQLDEGLPVTPEIFVQNEDEEISRFASDILFSRYELSSKWSERYAELTSDRHNLILNELNSSLTRLKLKKIDELWRENLEHIRIAETEDALKEAMEVQVYLAGLRKELSDKMGTVVVK